MIGARGGRRRDSSCAIQAAVAAVYAINAAIAAVVLLAYILLAPDGRGGDWRLLAALAVGGAVPAGAAGRAPRLPDERHGVARTHVRPRRVHRAAAAGLAGFAGRRGDRKRRAWWLARRSSEVIGTTIQHYRVRERLGARRHGRGLPAPKTHGSAARSRSSSWPVGQADPERRARLLTEARAASALRSSNIAAIYDIGEHEGADFLVMEYVEGDVLSARIAHGPLPVREAVDIARQVADALAEAHGRGIVHRDIKSANIIVTARGQVKVLDFGLAKFLQAPAGQASLDAALTVAPRHDGRHGAGHRAPTWRPSRRWAAPPIRVRICSRSASCSTRCWPAVCPSRASPSARSSTPSCIRCRRRWRASTTPSRRTSTRSSAARSRSRPRCATRTPGRSTWTSRACDRCSTTRRGRARRARAAAAAWAWPRRRKTPSPSSRSPTSRASRSTSGSARASPRR